MFQKKRRFSRKATDLDIPTKANRVLNVILVAFLLILFRIWHLAVIQYDEKTEESRKPQRKVVIEPAKRGTIRDRFNVPLAINKITYQAAVLYAPIRHIPAFIWEKNNLGKKVKKPHRKAYIEALSKVLGEELNMDPERIEDLIYSKASFYPQVPFVIKEEISEQEYYRLKMLEKDWLGIHAQIMPKRHYPLGKVGSDIIGYMGAINKTEYDAIVHEIKTLEQFVTESEEGGDPIPPEGVSSFEQAAQRLTDLQGHMYAINDYVGKTGVEAYFEEQLRGYHGKKSYHSDARGNYLRLLPNAGEPLSGQRLLLTISADLQEYAEMLLAQNERIRETRVCGLDAIKQAVLSVKQPWIKGGGIVAMDPKTGEILAMASYPRIDPNDFIASGHPEVGREKRSHILRWYETDAYIAEIWDQKRPFERERYSDAQHDFYDEKQLLTWNRYLDFILPVDSPVRERLERMRTIEQAIALQESVDTLLALSGQTSAYALCNELFAGEPHVPHSVRLSAQEKERFRNALEENEEEAAPLIAQLKKYLGPLEHNYDKVLLVDLCRLNVRADAFPNYLLEEAGHQSLAFYRDASAAMATLTESVQELARELFHQASFKPWRSEHEKAFLKEKRAAEKAARKYPKPYIDYLDQQERELFNEFWQNHRWQLFETLLLGQQPTEVSLQPYIEYFLKWRQEIADGAHASLPWFSAYHLLKTTLEDFSRNSAMAYLQSLRSFQDLDRPLLGRYRHMRSDKKQFLEKHLAAAFYPVYGYGYGRSYCYRQAATQGSIFKLITAYEALRQRYEQGGATLANLNPLEIVDVVQKNGQNVTVGYTMDGKPIPQFYKGGRVPKSLSKNIGKIDIIKAIETSSNPYFSLLAGDVLDSPEDLCEVAKLFSYGDLTGIELPWEIKGKLPKDLSYNRTGLYATAIGQHSLVVTPLQAAVMLATIANGGKVLKPQIVGILAGKQQVSRRAAEIKRNVFMPELVRFTLLEGMRRVVERNHHASLFSLSQFYRDYPEAISDYIDMKEALVGKTSTSESVENIDLDHYHGTNMYNHIWFGGIVFKESDNNGLTHVFKDQFGQPELIVVVYLRFGGLGKETAPLAAQVAQKWREIKQTNK